MSDSPLAEEVLAGLKERHPRYHEKAYLFVLAALQSVLERLPTPRHITGTELANGARDLAIDEFGPLARTVLEHWGIHRTEDLGRIVFALVDCGILIKEETDSLNDFRDVYDFEEAFEDNYPWGAGLSS